MTGPRIRCLLDRRSCTLRRSAFAFPTRLVRLSGKPLVASLGDSPTMSTRTSNAVYSGTTFGAALAIAISYNQWHSVLWAIIHGIFSWLYVLYFVVTR
jgi:hypothetical protein